MSKGWIKLHRCLLDHPLWLNSTPEQRNVLTTLLLMANHAERHWEFNGRPYTCKPGQMVTSIPSIRERCGSHVSIQNVRSALKRFKKLGFLTDKSTGRSRLISICNWEFYQNNEIPSNSTANSKLTDTSQIANSEPTPNKNVKNEKNVRRGPSHPSSFKTFEQMQIEEARASFERAAKEFLGGKDA
ncbi:MAG: hypothetical protein KAR47_19400 [Planctomycetes bacterium]|nr:hypothetical protein [Planctomycetota bacterium]